MTVPYVSGTVSVTAGNAVVTGVGTGWATALITGGMFGLDSANGNPVPIASIDSDTQLTLAKPWRGTSAAGQGYWIMRDTAYGQQTVANATALAQIINELRSAALAAFAGLTPAADKVPYFNGGGTADIADFKAKGRDLVSAATTLELLTKLGPVFGGSPPTPSGAGVGLVDGDFNSIKVGGVFNISGNWSNGPNGNGAYAGVLQVLQRNAAQAFQIYRPSTSDSDEAYIRFSAAADANSWPNAWKRFGAASVGTVFNRGGAPAGAIVERGSNANGEYVRFADGTQICWTNGNLNGTLNMSAAGSLFRDFNAVSWAYPVAFAGLPFPSISAIGSSNIWIVPLGVSGSSVASATVWSHTSFSGANFTYRPFAIGRWF